jgi:serine/threonine-protein kinase
MGTGAVSPEAMTQSVRKLGRYEIVGHLATGGMASVYRAKLAGTGGFSRDFALKVIHPHLCDTREFIERFLNEAWIASRLHHPNVAATIDAGTDAGYYYIVLELIEGVTLRQLSRTRSAPLPVDCAARIVADAARGLHALHDLRDGNGLPLNVVHRDLSPHNIMLDRGGRGILIDLGLAKVSGSASQTQTGVLCGRLPYMSPEQSRNALLDHRSDIFSLGSVLWELVLGAPPFGDDHSVATLARLQRCDHTELQAELFRRDVPNWLASVILVCLQREPENRFSSALAVAEALEQEAEAARIDSNAARRQLVIFSQQAQNVDDSAASGVYPAPLLRLRPSLRTRWSETWPKLAVSAGLAAIVGSWAVNQSGASVRETRTPQPNAMAPALPIEPVGEQKGRMLSASVVARQPTIATTKRTPSAKNIVIPAPTPVDPGGSIAGGDVADDTIESDGGGKHRIDAELDASFCPPSSQIGDEAGFSHECGESWPVSKRRRRSSSRRSLRHDTTTTLRPNPYDP